MQYILSLLPLLACPVGMGLMMWFMMRGNKGQAPPQADQAPMPTYYEPLTSAEPAQVITNASPQRASVLSLFGMCLNWKVVAGLAVVGVGVWIVAPRFVLGASVHDARQAGWWEPGGSAICAEEPGSCHGADAR